MQPNLTYQVFGAGYLRADVWLQASQKLDEACAAARCDGIHAHVHTHADARALMCPVDA
jgi:hypothetical protein